MTKTTRTAPPIPATEPGDAALGTTLEERTRHLCKLLENEMLTGKLRLGFGDYIRLIQWREAKGYNRPHKTVATWADPWWISLIEEMHDRPEIQAIMEEFKAKGLNNLKRREALQSRETSEPGPSGSEI